MRGLILLCVLLSVGCLVGAASGGELAAGWTLVAADVAPALAADWRAPLDRDRLVEPMLRVCWTPAACTAGRQCGQKNLIAGQPLRNGVRLLARPIRRVGAAIAAVRPLRRVAGLLGRVRPLRRVAGLLGLRR